MERLTSLLWIAALLFSFAACKDERFATPELTLQHYVEVRHMATIPEIENCLKCFTTKTKEWWDHNYVAACQAKMGAFNSLCSATRINESNIWSALIEPAGPSTAQVDSSNINETDGSAVLVVQGKKIYFLREGGNWKIDGLFGADDELKANYPQLKTERNH